LEPETEIVMGLFATALGLVIDDMTEKKFLSAGMKTKPTAWATSNMRIVAAAAVVLLVTRVLWPWAADRLAPWTGEYCAKSEERSR
jgi:hypothetical protein